LSNPRDRSILGITSIIIFLALSYLLLASEPKTIHAFRHSHIATYIIVLSFNIAIVLSWVGFGIFCGIAATVLSIFVAVIGVLRLGCYNATLFTLSFIPSTLAGYRYWLSVKHIEYSSGLSEEKAEESINVLSDELNKKRTDTKHLEEKMARYSELKDVAENLTTTLTMEEIARLVIEKAAGTVKKPGRVLLYLVDMQKQELMLSASSGSQKVKAKAGDIFDMWVLKQSIPLLVENVAQDFRFPSKDIEEAKNSFKSLIAVPLLSGDKVVGVLRMDSGSEGLYTQDDLRLLDILGGLSSVAISNAFLYSWVQDLAIRDSLTGLFVRRYFIKRLHEEIERARKKNASISLLMLDIDRFKWYNDKYGHAVGDIVLKHIANSIVSGLGAGDMASRYGGEEIAVLLSGADIKKAEKKAEAIRKAIEATPFTVRREKHSITVSIGVSSFPKDCVSEEELIKKSDERLYKAKSMGRNKVCAD
jgi:diguanylate cyclase (GGDEF)-like protein